MHLQVGFAKFKFNLMKKIVLSAVLITSLLSSCNNNKTENNGPQTFHIDLNAANDEADKLCKRMEMRLLPLESNAHSIFNDESAKMHVKGNTMIVEDPSQNGHIFVFDNQGNFIRHWNRLGQGNEEYTWNYSMATTDDRIYIQDHIKIQVYDYEGNYIQSIPNQEDRGTQIEVVGDKIQYELQDAKRLGGALLLGFGIGNYGEGDGREK